MLALVLGLREGLLEARRVRSARMRSSSSDAGSSFGSWRANLLGKAFFKAGRSTSILLRSDAHCPCVCSGIVSPCASSRGAGLNCHEEFDLAIESMQEAVTLAGKRTETLGGLAQPTRPLVSRQKPWNWSAELEGPGWETLPIALPHEQDLCLSRRQPAGIRAPGPGVRGEKSGFDRATS